MNDWISVKDRLPERLISVLVFMPEACISCRITVAYMRSFEEINQNYESWWYVAATMDHITAEVTHWMHLPSRPIRDQQVTTKT